MSDFIKVDDELIIKGPGFQFEIKEPWDFLQFAGTKLNEETQHIEYTGDKCFIIVQSKNPLIAKTISAFVETLLEH